MDKATNLDDEAQKEQGFTILKAPMGPKSLL